MPRQKQRTEELRDRILETAVDLIATEGVSGFTTRRIVEEASTSIPAMYELFGDKSGLARSSSRDFASYAVGSTSSNCQKTRVRISCL